MSGLGAKLVGGGSDSRPDNDFYPTPVEPIVAFMEAEAAFIRAFAGNRIAEPACGDGMMARVIEGYGFEVIKSDLVDRGCGARIVDFLAVETAPAPAMITNPPYDKDLAAKFVRHARRIGVDYLALLLPCRYWNTAGHLKLWSEWRPAAIYPITWKVDFLGLGNPVMEIDWVVWRRGQTDFTDYRPLPKPPAAKTVDLFGAAS